jgi:hypothetical protein
MLSERRHALSDSACDGRGSAEGCDEKQGRPAVSEFEVQIEGRTEDGRGPSSVGPQDFWTLA